MYKPATEPTPAEAGPLHFVVAQYEDDDDGYFCVHQQCRSPGIAQLDPDLRWVTR